MAQAEVERRMAEGRRHRSFVIGLYRIQLDHGRHFLHEHPQGALSWQEPMMKELLEHSRVRTVVSDQCEYGLVTPDMHGNLVPAKKPTRWATTSEHMA